MLQDQIGANIRRLRQTAGLTQERLADILCVSHQMISKYESGATAPDIATLVRLCGIFDVSLDELCGRDENAREALIRTLTEQYSGDLPGSFESAQRRFSAFCADARRVADDDRALALELGLLEAMRARARTEAQRSAANELLRACAARVLDLSRDDMLRSRANTRMALCYWETPPDSPDYEKNLALARTFASKILLCTYFPDYRLTIGCDLRSEKAVADILSRNIAFFARELARTARALAEHGVPLQPSDGGFGLRELMDFYGRAVQNREKYTNLDTEEKNMNLNPITLPDQSYDWTQTLQPEQPYLHNYARTFTYKIFLANPNETWDASVVHYTFAQALEVIRRMDALTPGLPKIAYLVGWQYYGHDSRYPAWDGVNEALKRPEDATALDSLKWLMDEGFRYHTAVSLHINIKDAYDDSPLWDTYVRNELIARNADGSLMEGGVWNNKQCYLISYCREWETGYLRARIDRLCAMLPIVRAGTIHIDAMQAFADPGHGYSLDDCQRARNQIVRYFRRLGIDVTTEFIYYESPDWREKKEQLIGLCPLVYHLSQNLDEYIRRPAALITGVYCSRRFKEGNSDQMDRLFGRSAPAEQILLNSSNESEKWGQLHDAICLDLTKLMYLNSLTRERAVVTADNITAFFSDGVETDLRGTMKKNGVLLAQGTDIFCPMTGLGAHCYLAYCRTGGTISVDMAAAFGYRPDASFVLRSYTPEGIGAPQGTVLANDGQIVLHLAPGQAVILAAE